MFDIGSWQAHIFSQWECKISGLNPTSVMWAQPWIVTTSCRQLRPRNVVSNSIVGRQSQIGSLDPLKPEIHNCSVMISYIHYVNYLFIFDVQQQRYHIVSCLISSSKHCLQDLLSQLLLLSPLPGHTDIQVCRLDPIHIGLSHQWDVGTQFNIGLTPSLDVGSSPHFSMGTRPQL